MNLAQVRIFGCLFVGYAFYILCRKSFSFMVPAINSSENLSNEELGLIVSSQNAAYAVSKFAVGVLSDRVSARVLFSLGLAGAGLSVLGFSTVGALPLYAGLWFSNGLFAGAGWPAASKLLTRWFRPEEFGTAWSILSASMNVTGTLFPLFLPWLLLWTGGWRGVMFYSGLISLAWAVVSLITIANSPEDIGLAAIGQPDQKKENSEAGGQFLSAFEVGGFTSSLLTGYLTDWAVSIQGRNSAHVRMSVGLFYMIGTVLALVAVIGTQTFLPLLAFLLGGFLYGNINIFGIVAVESAPPHLSGTSHALVALAGSLGGVGAGLPITLLASHIGWTGVFYLLATGASLSVLLMLSPDPKPTTKQD